MLISKGSQASYEPAPSPFLNFMPLLSLPSCIYLGSNQMEMLSLPHPPHMQHFPFGPATPSPWTHPYSHFIGSILPVLQRPPSPALFLCLWRKCSLSYWTAIAPSFHPSWLFSTLSSVILVSPLYYTLICVPWDKAGVLLFGPHMTRPSILLCARSSCWIKALSQ